MHTVKVTSAGSMEYSGNKFVQHYRWLIYKSQPFL